MQNTKYMYKYLI